MSNITDRVLGSAAWFQPALKIPPFAKAALVGNPIAASMHDSLTG
jgi:hypothetical protein